MVFYIAPIPTDLDGDGNEDQGLICAIEDQGPVPWYNGSNLTTGVTDTAIDKGANNTSIIIDIQGEIQTDYAAGLARAYRGGGYTDWFLPSKDELNEMYDSKSILEANSEFTEIGNSYWSSSEFDKYKAWSIFYSSSNHYSKNFSLQVRLIRAF